MYGDLFSPLRALKRRKGLGRVWVGFGRLLYDPNQNEVKRKLKRSAVLAKEWKNEVGLGRVTHKGDPTQTLPVFSLLCFYAWWRLQFIQ